MRDLTGRRALVTGAGGGIGRGIADVLAERGASVAINDIELDRAAAAADELQRAHGLSTVAVPGDVSKRADVERMFEAAWSQLGPIDILVNNAGIETIVPFLELTDDQWTRLVDVNLRGAWLCSQVFCRRVVAEQRPAAIIHIGSIQAGKVLPGRTHYAPAEARARRADAEHVRGDDAARHPRQLHPSRAGRHADDRLDHEGRRGDAEDPRRRSRWAGPGNRARSARSPRSWSSADASYLTGQSIYVDGGWQGK